MVWNRSFRTAVTLPPLRAARKPTSESCRVQLRMNQRTHAIAGADANSGRGERRLYLRSRSGIFPVHMERTLILCKPDCVARNLVGTVLDRFERAGLKISAAKMLRLTPALLTEHYSHLKDRPFFPEILTS